MDDNKQQERTTDRREKQAHPPRPTQRLIVSLNLTATLSIFAALSLPVFAPSSSAQNALTPLLPW